MSGFKVLFKKKKSEVAGSGNFATENIQSGKFIGTAFIIIGDTGNTDNDIQRLPLGIYTNHSLTPNMRIEKVDDCYRFISSRAIKKDEELFVNYQNFDFDGKRPTGSNKESILYKW